MASGDDALREAAVRAIGTWKVASLQKQLVELAACGGYTGGCSRRRDRGTGQEGRGRRAPGRRGPDASAVPRPRSRRGSWPRLWKLIPRRRPACRRVARPASRPTSSMPAGDRARSRSGAARSTRLAGLGPRPTAAPNLSADLAKLCIRQVRASGRDEPGLIAALEKAGRLKESAQEAIGQGNEPALDRRVTDWATLRGARRSFAART